MIAVIHNKSKKQNLFMIQQYKKSFLDNTAGKTDFQRERRLQGQVHGQAPSSTVHSQQLSSAVASDFILTSWIIPLLRPARCA
jgi:hypothetical protein